MGHLSNGRRHNDTTCLRGGKLRLVFGVTQKTQRIGLRSVKRSKLLNQVLRVANQATA
jgi:hypothetical protein